MSYTNTVGKREKYFDKMLIGLGRLGTGGGSTREAPGGGEKGVGGQIKRGERNSVSQTPQEKTPKKVTSRGGLGE